MCGRVRVRAALRVRCRVQAVGDGRVVLQELQRLVHQARVALATDVHGDPVEHSPDAVLAAEPQLLHKLHQRPGRRLAPHQPQRARVEEQPVGVGRTQGPRQRVGARLGPPHLEGGPQAVGEDRVTACDDCQGGDAVGHGLERHALHQAVRQHTARTPVYPHGPAVQLVLPVPRARHGLAAHGAPLCRLVRQRPLPARLLLLDRLEPRLLRVARHRRSLAGRIHPV
mmetsp:Transcript_31019/g.79123  ORF Transcript_31019/g.79123 Transcript_31019/m.79123 type:complete len:226 (-) Transcript_31019:591-1268(-)